MTPDSVSLVTTMNGCVSEANREGVEAFDDVEVEEVVDVRVFEAYRPPVESVFPDFSAVDDSPSFLVCVLDEETALGEPELVAALHDPRLRLEEVPGEVDRDAVGVLRYADFLVSEDW